MAGTQTTLSLQDKLTGPLMKMMKAMDNTIKVMENMDKAANNIDTKALANARKSIDNASADMMRLKANTSATAITQKSMNDQVNAGTNSFKSLGKSILGVAAAYLSIQAIANGFNKLTAASDTYVSTSARLGNINDGLQTQKELQDKIFAAAQRSRGAYVDMADSVAKLNLLAGDAFSSNDEAIRFSELMNKAFTISGASTTEKQAGTHQLTQAMASGRLQGDEFRSITENAPMLAVAIADAMGVSMGALKKLSSEGKITADIIKASLFMAADDIEDKFKTMPVTFGQAMTMMKNEGLRAFEPLLIRFSEFVNSDTFATLSGQVMTFVTVAVAGLMILFDIIGGVYDALSAVAEYWPIIAAGLAVIIAIYLPTMLSALWAMITPLLIQASVWAMIYWPITLVIGIIIALITIMMHFGVTTEQILGFVGGLFFALGATIWNIVANMWNVLAMFAEFLINLFIDPTYAMKKLMYDMAKHVIDNMATMGSSFDNVANALGSAFVAGANIAIGGINLLIKALNSIPGVKIDEVDKMSASTSSIVSGGLKAMANNLEAPTSSKNVVAIPRMELKNLPGAYQAGQKAGSSLKLPGMPKMPGADMGAMGVVPNLSAIPKGAKNPTGGKLDKIGKIEDDINIADEDLQMLKELADIKSIQNFRTLQPSFTFGDVTVREDADITKIIKGIETYMRDEMDRSGEGVYA